jgi:hypothetical protein
MKPQQTMQRATYLTIGLGVFFLITLIASWLVVAVYINRDDRTIVRRLASWFPIGQVGGQTVRYGQFLKARDAIKNFLNSKAVKDAGGGGQQMTAQIEQSAYERLLREAASRDLAAEKKISVSDQEVKATYDKFVEQASSTVPDVKQYIQDTFHWSVEEYQQMVVRPQTMDDKLALTFATGTDGYNQLNDYFATRLEKPDVKRYLKFE